MTLAEFITQNKDSIAAHEQGDLQFLFKVLSVNKALSVQVHPTNVS
jgi:mannose-6-phosphate isomerase class I